MKRNYIKRDKKFYWKLFISTFTLSAFTFGGGYVIVPLMQERFVKDYKWIEEDEMLDLVAISQSAPGPIAVNASILLGYRMAGIPGSLATILGTVLPPLITITVISFFYLEFRDNKLVGTLLKGMQAGVAAVIADVVISMASRIIKNKAALSIVIMVLAFIAAAVLNISVIYILLACGAIGAFATLRAKRQEKEEEK
jgi:chromate transporter